MAFPYHPTYEDLSRSPEEVAAEVAELESDYEEAARLYLQASQKASSASEIARLRKEHERVARFALLMRDIDF